MMSSILLNPQLFFYSFALGSELALLRLALCFLGGCIAGLLVRIYFRETSFYRFTAFDIPASHNTDPNLFLRVLKNIWQNVNITAPYFLLGVVLTALYQRYVPVNLVARLFGKNQGLLVMIIGVIFSVHSCKFLCFYFHEDQWMILSSSILPF